MNRRSVMIVLIGAIAALCGLGATALLQAAPLAEGLVALGVMFVVAFVLLRVLLFATGRMPRRQ